MSRSVDPALTTPEPERQSPPPELPAFIGRYRVERLLGEGGFGRVYLAYDEPLQRFVAVKVPHNQSLDPAAYVAEARILARLDHPHIVPVYDIGSTDQFPCYVVSKYIEGIDLAQRLEHSRPSIAEAVQLVTTIADALHSAHKQGLVHRDIKPSNLLLEGEPGASAPGCRCYIADFGLALKEEEFGKGPQFAGTPAYMSPEQARCEGHRVDGRSDIFSLGVVFYELLTGRRPFNGSTRTELLDQITSLEPRPPRQMDDTIPRELERICLKALAKRAADRYTTALDLADDLRHWQQETPADRYPSAKQQAPVISPTPTITPILKIIPRGLRSFDAADADFFLDLLPGPRDRDGLPESLHFWKRRIEETDADNAFTVGLLYGPSGCGKSSLVKAGLLPRLAEHVLPVYVEATGEQTESRLLAAIAKCCPSLLSSPPLRGRVVGGEGVFESPAPSPPTPFPRSGGEESLVAALAAARRSHGLPGGKKLLIILDQFE
jgi:serine/threonine protein kinase